MAKTFKVTGLDEFNKAVKKALKQNEDIQREILVKVSMDGHRELQRTTPFKEGRARAGWNNTVDKAPSEWKPPEGQKHYPLTPFKDVARIKAYTPVNLSNNVEYIIPLEKGHSKQNQNMVAKMISGLTAQLVALTRKESRRRVK